MIMDAQLLARIQFAFTVGFHYIFPPLTIGLGWMIFGMMTRWLRSGDDRWGAAARFFKEQQSVKQKKKIVL